jgi:hypothetical protein
MKAASKGSTWSLLSTYAGGVGTVRTAVSILFFSDRPALRAAWTSASDGGALMSSFALGPGGSVVVAETTPAGGSVLIKKFDTAGTLLAQTTLSSSPLDFSDVELDRQGRTIVVLVPPNVSPHSAAGTPLPPPGKVVVLDATLAPLGSWTAPVDVVAPAVALDGQGRVLLGGRRVVIEGVIGNMSSPRAWLQSVDVSTLEPVWPAAIVGGDGEAAAIHVARNGDILVAGHDASVWLERYTADGDSRWSRRAETAAAQYQVSATGVAEQSNGSIFVSISGGALAFPANAAPSACDDS